MTKANLEKWAGSQDASDANTANGEVLASDGSGNNAWTDQVLLNGSATILNGGAGDIDTVIKKETSGDAYTYDAGTDLHTFESPVRIESNAFTVIGTAASNPQTLLQHNNNESSSPIAIIRTSRGTEGSPTDVANGDLLGQYVFQGYGGGSYNTWAVIDARVNDASPDANTNTRMRIFLNDGTAQRQIADWNVGNLIFNAAEVDTDFTVKKSGGGDALSIDAGDESFTIGNGIYEPIRTVSSFPDTVLADDVALVATGTGTINLPAAASSTGRRLTIKNKGTGTVTIDGNASENIDGSATKVLSSQYEYISLRCDGTEWWEMP